MNKEELLSGYIIEGKHGVTKHQECLMVYVSVTQRLFSVRTLAIRFRTSFNLTTFGTKSTSVTSSSLLKIKIINTPETNGNLAKLLLKRMD